MLARYREQELMDDPALPGAEHRKALKGLERINRLSGASRATWRGVRRTLEQSERSTECRILDVATGSGDVAVGVARLARTSGIHVRLHLVDVSPEALRMAGVRAEREGVVATLERCDVLRDGLSLPDRAVDVSMSSLFLHHLDEGQAESVLREMARVARLGVVINDLVRGPAGLAAARIGSRFLTRSRVVHVDAVRSVRAAWTLDELRRLAAHAGLVGAIIRPIFPFRMLLTWSGA
jgi:ubiquinone/menaquinone biosynthesis C-methylase UbiE